MTNIIHQVACVDGAYDCVSGFSGNIMTSAEPFAVAVRTAAAAHAGVKVATPQQIKDFISHVDMRASKVPGDAGPGDGMATVQEMAYYAWWRSGTISSYLRSADVYQANVQLEKAASDLLNQ